ncbi:TRADD-N-associated membrane domain-containing protein [Streptomyces sp. NPDC055210]
MLAVGTGGGVFGTITILSSEETPDWLRATTVIISMGSIGWSYWSTFRPRERWWQGPVQTRERVREAERGLEQALRGVSVSVTSGVHLPSQNQGSEHAQNRLTLSELWAVTHRRLDHYHGIALGQARQSFLNAQIAMGAGFVFLLAFVIVALHASTVAGTVVAGGLGAVSAALAGFVSRTFIRSQEASAQHLRAYFDQPLEFSRYLAAERLMADSQLSEEHRAEILSNLVQAMIAGPANSTVTTAEDQPTVSRNPS